MGNVAEVFRWTSIAPKETVGVFIHPYGDKEFVSFGINVDLRTNQPPGAFSSIGAQLTEGPTYKHVDGTARKLFVENQTVGPQPYITVGLIRFRQNA